MGLQYIGPQYIPYISTQQIFGLVVQSRCLESVCYCHSNDVIWFGQALKQNGDTLDGIVDIFVWTINRRGRVSSQAIVASCPHK